MKRIQAILNNADFSELLQAIKTREKGRKYCKHNLRHFLDVARIGYILTLEEHIDIPKETVYAAALLHDIGRKQQYDDGTPHEKASAKLAVPILYAAGFTEGEIKEITEAILTHRDSSYVKNAGLKGILFRADKLSRNCMFCKENERCDWRHKNGGIEI